MQYNVTYREKDGSIQVIIQYKDSLGKWKQKSKQGFKKKSLAKIAADKIIDNLKENAMYDQEFSNYQIKSLKEIYLEHIKIYKEYNTYISTKNSLKRFNILDEIVINDLKRIDIQKAINELVKKSYSVETISSSFEILKTFLNYISINYEVKIPLLKGLTLPKKEVSSKKALEPKELSELLKLFKERINYSLNYYLAVLLASKAGLRAGEIMALTWSDIDFKNNTLIVNKQLKRRKSDGAYEIGSLKSKNSYRVIPLSNFLRKELIYIQKNFPLNFDNRLLNINTTVCLTVNLNKKLKPNFNISLHELRHTFATDLISNGIDFKTAAAILGHDVKETIDTYSHVTDDMMDKAKKIINNI